MSWPLTHNLTRRTRPMTMKLINKLRSITHTLSMGMLFKPHQDPTVCPEHGPMAGITGPANPDIDPDKMWDTIYYCPECLQEEQEAEKKALTEDSEKSDNFNWPAPRTDLFATRTEEIEDALKHHCMSPEQRKAYTEELEAEKKATPPEERTDIFYEDDDSVIKGWYHKTEDGDMRGPYPTRDEALIELGESIANRKENEVAHLHMTQDSEKSDNTELFTELFKLNDIVTAVYTLEKHQRGSYPLMTAGREYRICSVSQIVNQSNPQWAKPTYETSYRLVDTNEEAIYRPSFDGNHFEATGVEKWQECDHDYRTPWIKENHLCAVVQLEKTIQSLAIQELGDKPVGAQVYLDDNLWLENAGKVDLTEDSEKSDN